MFTIQVYRDNDVLTGANIAIMNNLFINGWGLYDALEDLFTDKINPDTWDRAIVIGSVNDIPVCVVFYIKTKETNYHQIMAFCVKQHRRNGYTSKCISLLNPPSHTDHREGIKGSLQFWERVGIKVR
jgi:hypothetical protein